MFIYVEETSCSLFLLRSSYTCTMIAEHPKLLEYILILYASIKVKIMKAGPIFLVPIQSWLSAALFSANKLWNCHKWLMHSWKHDSDHHQWKFYVLMHRKTWLVIAVAQQVSAATVEVSEPYHISWVQRWTVWQVSDCLWIVNLSCPIASLESRLCVPISWEGFWKQMSL